MQKMEDLKTSFLLGGGESMEWSIANGIPQVVIYKRKKIQKKEDVKTSFFWSMSLCSRRPIANRSHEVGIHQRKKIYKNTKKGRS